MHSIIGISIKFLKCWNNSSTQKRFKKPQNSTTDHLAFFRTYQKYMKSISFSKSQITSKIYCQYINLVFKKHAVDNNVCLLWWKLSGILTDLSKALDCLFHDLLIAELHAYGFDIPGLRLLHNYLANRKLCQDRLYI